MSKAPEFKERVINLLGTIQQETAIAAIKNAPLGIGLECVLRPVKKVRGLDANARMWAGPLRDIAEQAWVGNRQYSAELWHEYYKQEYLPEENDPELDRLVKDWSTYKKWDSDLRGNRVCIGSTTQLTKRGFALYVEQIEAHGAGMGVRFSASPNEYRWAA